MRLKKEHIGSVVTVNKPFKIDVLVCEDNAALLIKLKQTHLFEHDNDRQKPKRKQSKVNTSRTKRPKRTT
jgi:hypothetical protein